MVSIDRAAKKWADNTRGKGARWAERVKAVGPDHWADKMASFLGVSKAAIKRSTPYKNYESFASTADPNAYDSGVSDAAAKDRWRKRLRDKFSS